MRSDGYAEIPWKAFAFGMSIASLVTIFMDLFVLGWLTETLILFSLAVILAAGVIFVLLSVLFPGFGWFLYLFLIPFWATFPIMVIGGKATLVVFLIFNKGFTGAKF